MLALGGIVTVATSRTIDRLERSVAALNETAATMDQAIQAVRSQIYVSSLLLRDSILDQSSARQPEYTRRIHEYHRVSLSKVEAVLRLSPPTARRPVIESLAREVHAYWDSALPIFSEAQDKAVGYEYIRTKILPRRQAVITLAEELSDLQATETRAAHREMSVTIAAFRARITQIRGLAAGLVALVALLCTWRVYRLQKIAEAEKHRRKVAEQQLRSHAHDLVKAHEDERRSLSRELHDHIGQMVTAIRFRLGNVEAETPTPTASFRQNVAECRSLLEETIDAIRQIAMGLRPAMLDDLGMTSAIEWYIREFSRRFDLPASLTADSIPELPEPHRTYIYRIVQEALTNCARHSKATAVEVEIRQMLERITVRVRDNGVGIGKGEMRRAGIGLTGIEERVRELKGTISIYSPQEGGTVVEVLLPIPAGVTHA